MYLNEFDIAIVIIVLMFLGAAGNEFAKWIVTRKDKKAKFTDTLEKVRK